MQNFALGKTDQQTVPLGSTVQDLLFEFSYRLEKNSEPHPMTLGLIARVQVLEW